MRDLFRASALIVVPSATRGGAERVAFLLARELAIKGVQLFVYAMVGGMQPDLVELARYPNVRIFAPRRKRERYGALSAAWSIFKLSRRYDFDLVYSTHVHVNALLGWMRRWKLLRCERLVARESTVIFERFSGVLGTFFRMLYWIGYGSQDLLIAQTSEMRSNLVAELGRVPAKRFEVIRNPIDLERARLLALQVPVAPLPRKRIVACGRVVPNKGFGELIEAFLSLCGKYPDIDFVLVGEGPQLADLRRSIPPELESRVVFLGQLENPFPIFYGADVGVISSRKEGFPNVLLEMMSCGVQQVVSTPCTAAIGEIEGVVVSAGTSAEDIARALDFALSSPESKAQDYGNYLRDSHSLAKFCARVAPSIFCSV